MEVIKRYTAIQLKTINIGDEVNVRLVYGMIEGPYYNQTEPEEIFDTEDEAIEYAYKSEPYGRWLILPVISFNNFS